MLVPSSLRLPAPVNQGVRLLVQTDKFAALVLAAAGGGSGAVVAQLLGESSWLDAKMYIVTGVVLGVLASKVLLHTAAMHSGAKRRLTRFTGLVAVIAALAFVSYQCIQFFQSDKCLDRGGRWNEAARTCEGPHG